MPRRKSAKTLCLCALALLALSSEQGAAARKPRGTNLLFTFVTNQAGFDTGITIANTTADPLGTTSQDGSCTLSFFGFGAPAPVTTGTIAAGTVFTAAASLQAPGFQGYMIASCDFPLAHGWAFVSDVGVQNVAASYPALVIPSTNRKQNERLSN